jgi:DNA recombination protein RmuC
MGHPFGFRLIVFDFAASARYNRFAVKGKAMEGILLAIVAVLLVAVVAVLFVLMGSVQAARRDAAAQTSTLSALQQQVDAVKTSSDALRDATTQSLQKGHENVTQSLRTQQEALGRLNSQLIQLAGDSKKMVDLGSDLRRLQDILANPKLRGQLGEWSLGNMLANVLPASSFTLQHSFKDGKIVDALVLMPDFSVPIDAKFPLPAFEAILAAESDDARTKARRRFQSDVIKHIDKIAASYIRPAEGTLDFALMYIPAENVYYETVSAGDGEDAPLHYALGKKVIPVSPTLLYAYLMTIVMGLHGLQIEKQAAEIRTHLGKLNSTFADFASTFDTLGRHLRNAGSQYEEGSSKLTKLGSDLEHIQQPGA